MPYQFRNEDAAAKAVNAQWVRVRRVRDLSRALATVDYSVVESRREGHRTLVDFLNNMEPSESIFDEETRFPGGFVNSYLTNFDSNVGALFVSLIAVLSYRTSNNAKDIEAGNNAKKEKETLAVTEQGVQDNTKRFEELKKELDFLPNNDAIVWRRNSFEAKLHADWVNPAGP